MLIDVLAQANEGVTGGSGDIVTIVYILTSISLIVGFVVGTYKYVQRQKNKWTDEGITRQKQAQMTAENTDQLRKNTEATDRLSAEFGKFALSVRTEINGLGRRVGLLEQYWHTNNHPNGNGEWENK